MDFKVNDYVMVDHPDYPELNGLARVIIIKPGRHIIRIKRSYDQTEWMVSIDFLRHATDEEIRAASKS